MPSLACPLLLSVGLAWGGPKAVPMDRVDGSALKTRFEGRRIALLVGPESFGDARFPELRFTADDALALAEALEDPALGRFDLVLTLTDPEETRLDAVRRAMDQISAASESPEDTVVVYFSTHGTLARDRRGSWEQCLVLADTRMDRPRETGLCHDELLDWLDALESQRKLLVLATCHSGQGKSAFSDTVRAELAGLKGPPTPPLMAHSAATMVVGVCAWNETARESEDLGHDIYTAFLLDALDKGDLDGDGAVTATEAHDLARQATWAFTGGQQRAYARVEVTGADPIVLAGHRRRRGLAEIAAWDDTWAGYRLSVDGALKGTLPGSVRLEPGRHEISLLGPEGGTEGGTVIFRRRVRVEEGARLSVDGIARRDRIRLGVGAGWAFYGAGPVDGPLAFGELHLPRLPAPGWELVANGGVLVTWPHPSLMGGLAVDRAWGTGALQARTGLGFEASLLQAPGLLAPTLVPEARLAATWLPGWRGERFPLPLPSPFLSLGAQGGWLWYTNEGRFESSFSARLGLSGGGAF